MRRDQTDATLGHTDYHPQTRPAARFVTTMPTPARPRHATANLRATFGVIGGLLLVWVVIVTA
jgi:hypothetical protein